ncbi:MATE efflux family protein [Gottschalkia purinilytica]|uniref:Multidrug export protein MepA n=1 Tax=Gottschalkia purinilytica TaxID=1503 RepID=A0A0L0W8J6_GOTPU|nr:MATE family efflux transporter [Gottschalkia purinilytica]KNF07771.1 MATE efflux family protein [Gottschalkia purinilytica]
MDRSKQLGEESIGKLLINFSIPAIVGMVVNAVYNIVDRIFIGRFIGDMGLAGVVIAYPIMLIIMAFAMLIGFGATSLISIKLGEGKQDEAESILGNAFTLMIIFPLVLTAVGLFFLDDILVLFGASKNVLPYAEQYLSIILIGAVFQTIGFGMNNFIRSEGNPKVAMGTMLVGAIINTILDPILISVVGLGIKGAALATILAQLASAIWVLYYFFSGNSLLKVRKPYLKLKSKLVSNILALGSAQFAIQLANSLIILLFNRALIRHGGDLAISAYGIINSISTMILMPIFGINQGSQPIVGYNYGARKYDRVKKTLKLSITGATIIVLIGFAVSMLFPEQLVSLFSKGNKELTKLASNGMRLFFLMYPVIGFQIVASNYFQATGKPKQALFLSMSRQVIVLIPAILILPNIFGLNGIWAAGPTADFLASLLTGTFLILDLKNLDRMKNQNQFL